MEYDNRTDAELAVLARQGDTSAFEALVRRYFGAVYGLAYGWTRNAQDAEDLTQEAFYRAFERLRSLRDPSSFPAWLRTLTRNLCRMWHRSGRVLLSLDDPQFDELKKEVADPGYTPSEVLEARERDRAVHAVLDELPESMRHTTMLFYVNEWSHRQIGLFLGVPISTVKMRLFKARERSEREGLPN